MFEVGATPAQTPAAVELVREHPYRRDLGALTYDWLSRQAEAGALFSGREFVEQRARDHQVERSHAETPAGNLLAILERGPEARGERDLVLAFAADGLRQRLEDVGQAGRDEVLARFARHGAWLATTTPMDPFPFVRTLLDPPERDALWSKLGEALLHDDDPSPAGRARQAARLAVLAGAGEASAEAVCERIAREHQDPWLARWATATSAQGETSAPGESAEPQAGVRGRVGGAPTPSARGALRIVSGVAALQWLARTVGWLVGLRREAAIALVPGGVRIHRHTRLLGRTVREREETFALAAVAGAGRLTRYPALPMLTGLLALSVGVLLGGLWLFEGIRSGETVLLLVAAGAILLGGGLDLLLSVIFPGRRGRVTMDLHVLSGPGVRLRRVPQEDADAFLEALARRLG